MTDFGILSKIVEAIKGLLQERKEKTVWEEYVVLVRWLKAKGGNSWSVTLGSEDHHRSEAFVQRGWAARTDFSQTYRPLA